LFQNLLVYPKNPLEERTMFQLDKEFSSMSSFPTMQQSVAWLSSVVVLSTNVPNDKSKKKSLSGQWPIQPEIIPVSVA
jgi:hypothetical protein